MLVRYCLDQGLILNQLLLMSQGRARLIWIKSQVYQAYIHRCKVFYIPLEEGHKQPRELLVLVLSMKGKIPHMEPMVNCILSMWKEMVMLIVLLVGCLNPSFKAKVKIFLFYVNPLEYLNQHWIKV